MGLKTTLDPTVMKVAIIAVLLFVEGFAISAYAVTQTGRMPTETEWLTFLFGATIQLATFVLTFLGFTHDEEKK